MTKTTIECGACGPIGTIRNRAQSAIMRMEHLEQAHPEAWAQLQEARDTVQEVQASITAQFVRVGYY